MKILAIADIHGNYENVEEIVKIAREKDIRHMLVLGDFPEYKGFRDRQWNVRSAAAILDLLTKDHEVMAIPGNCDHPEVVDLFRRYDVNLHGEQKEINGVSFKGFGGALPTPFHTPYEIRENVFHEKIKELFNGNEEKVVLVTHQPPYKTNSDRTGQGIHSGSPALRDVIERKQPDVCLCAHIHESAGQTDYIGESLVCNVGPLKIGHYAVLDSKEMTVEPRVLEK